MVKKQAKNKVDAWKRRWLIIQQKIKESGIDQELFKYQDKIKETENKVYNSSSAITHEIAQYIAVRGFIRDILKNKGWWLNKWITDKVDYHRLEDVHYDIYEFLETGKVKDKYRQGGIFNYNPIYKQIVDGYGNKRTINMNTELIMIARGLGKSVAYHTQSVIQELLNDPYQKILITHGDLDKAENNLRDLKDYIRNPWLCAIAPDIFHEDEQEYLDAGGKLTKSSIDIKIPETVTESIDNIRFRIGRERTVNVGSMGANLTGSHYDREYDDDPVTPKNSSTDKMAQDVIDWYWETKNLAKNPGIYPRRITGTMHNTPNLYTSIIPDITCFVLDGMWLDSKGKKHFVSKRFDKQYVEDQKKNQDNWRNMQANFFMTGNKRNADDVLVTDDSFIFKFKDEMNDFKAIPYQKNELLMQGCVVTSKDPSYSSANNKSKDATATGVIAKDGCLYILEETEIVGAEIGEIDNTIYPIILNHINKYNSDLFIQDAQSNQSVLAEIYGRKLQQTFKNLEVNYYTKPPVSGTKNKAERAKIVLGELFRLGKIKIHWSCIKTINDIKGKTKSKDFLDVLIQIAAYGDFEDVGNYFYNTKKYRMANILSMDSKRRSKKIINKVAGY
jgi:hypothetical protein